MNSFLKTIPSAEFVEQFNRRAHGVEGRYFQDARIVAAGDAFVLVFLQQGFEHGARLRPIAGEHVALAPRERRLVEGHVADQVEWVEVFAHLFGQRIEQQALGGEFIDDRLLAFGALPAPEKGVEAGELLPQCFF